MNTWIGAASRRRKRRRVKKKKRKTNLPILIPRDGKWEPLENCEKENSYLIKKKLKNGGIEPGNTQSAKLDECDGTHWTMETEVL